FVDQFVSAYFTIPVTMTWQETRGLPIPDTYLGTRLNFAGLATSWLNLERMTLVADQLRFVPDMPIRMTVAGAQAEIVIGQTEITRWLERFQLPFKLELAEDGILVRNEFSGMPLAEFKTALEVVDGWFMLKPKTASFMGMPGWMPEFFRTYLPLPPLANEARIKAIEHAQGKLTLIMNLPDFEEPVTPGLLGRLQRRIFPAFG
ncbi:MAG: hypothetical protein O3A63_21620, partial [Proteobacteria bacterium]|nr:hypothetical protein [Pseudomonadota bacterium]